MIDDRVPIDILLNTQPIDTTQNTAPIDTTQNTSPIDTLHNTAIIDTLHNTSPIDTLQNTATIETLQNTSPIVLIPNTSPIKTVPHTPTIQVVPTNTRIEINRKIHTIAKTANLQTNSRSPLVRDASKTKSTQPQILKPTTTKLKSKLIAGNKFNKSYVKLNHTRKMRLQAKIGPIDVDSLLTPDDKQAPVGNTPRYSS